ncbi:MAG TPA: fused MFS/spermidine synthase, partial [Candidatus Binatia bacterium]|nr:fused MFS/spermidine synthase [Candidatus Binatia bacterium]
MDMPSGFSRTREGALLTIAFLCFFLSGAAGLIYEVVWTRMLTQIFGNTTYAIATVLAAFMAGLAVGSYLFGRIADRGKNDFLLYGILEAGVGLYGIAVPWLFQVGRHIYIPLYHLNESLPFVFNLMLFVLSFFLLVLPTMLMGATLPVLSRFFVRSYAQIGRRVGDLYGTNTLGAVLGCAISGYFLIPTFGMRRTVFIAAGMNLAIALVIFIVDRLRDKAAAAAPAAEEAAPSAEIAAERSSLDWILLVSFGLSGMAALVYENAWTRALTLVIGSSIYSFTTMLVTFLVGLAIGGFLYGRLMGDREVRLTTFGIIEILVGLTALATIPLFGKLPLIFLRLMLGFGDSFNLFLAIQVLTSAMVMFVPTLLLGMTFPLVARLFTQSLYRVGASVGTSYAANTLGAIIGAFAGGFIFIPYIGVQNSIILAVVLNLLIGSMLMVADPRLSQAPRVAIGAAVLAGIVLIYIGTPAWDRSVMTSGVTVYSDRYESLHTDSLRVEEMRRDDILFYKEGLTATVSVHRSAGSEYKYFRTNGKIDGSYGDALSQLMTGYIPMLFRPKGGERAAVIGLGTGMTSRAVAAFPFKEVEILEIEPAMREATTFFNDKNGKILENPKVHLIPTDGRNYILATPKKYDVIAAEPSNPWIAGIANLYTREFYSVVKSKLKPDGVFAQWFHNYSMSPDDFKMVFHTFTDAFPYVTVWGMKESDFLMVGTMQEQVFRYPELKELFAKNEILKSDFEDLGLSDPYAVLGFYRMGRQGAVAFAEGASFNTDDGAQLEFSAPKSLGRATSELNRKLMTPYLSAPPWLDAPIPEAMRHFYLAQAHEANSWHSKALEEVQKAIELEPNNASFYVLKTHILLEAEKNPEALKAAMQAMEKSPQTVGAILALSGDFYLSEAQTVYRKAIQLGLKDYQPYLGLANIALFRHDAAEAEKWLAQAKKLAPENQKILLAEGRLALEKNDAPQARTLLERARDKGEKTDALYVALAEACRQMDAWPEAADAYARALRLKRTNVELRRKLGVALAKIGKTREAEQKFREVLASSPDDSES